MRVDDAVTIALATLRHVLADQDMLRTFMMQSGIDEAGIRAHIDDPDFLSGVLDFVLGDDDRVAACATELSMAPEDVVRARHALPNAGWDD